VSGSNYSRNSWLIPVCPWLSSKIQLGFLVNASVHHPYITFITCQFANPRSHVEVEAYFVQWTSKTVFSFVLIRVNWFMLFIKQTPSTWFTERLSVLRESEKKQEDIYEKLPWFQLEETYSKTEAGRMGLGGLGCYLLIMVVDVTFKSPCDLPGRIWSGWRTASPQDHWVKNNPQTHMGLFKLLCH